MNTVNCSAFEEDLGAAILDGKEIDISFDNFPYYLRYISVLLYIYCVVITHEHSKLFFLIFEFV